MATKTANLYARIEPETKVCAESILESLGIPVSTAINMFYKQIILNNGMPFELKLPKNKNIDISKMTESQFNSEMEKAYQEMQDKKGISVTSAFSSIKRAE
jgi:DNA-damage-inducible protein J